MDTDTHQEREAKKKGLLTYLSMTFWRCLAFLAPRLVSHGKRSDNRLI